MGLKYKITYYRELDNEDVPEGLSGEALQAFAESAWESECSDYKSTWTRVEVLSDDEIIPRFDGS